MKKEDIKDKINNVSKSIRADIISTKYGDRKVYRDEMGRFTSGNSYKSNKENGSNFGARSSKTAFIPVRILNTKPVTGKPYFVKV